MRGGWRVLVTAGALVLTLGAADAWAQAGGGGAPGGGQPGAGPQGGGGGGPGAGRRRHRPRPNQPMLQRLAQAFRRLDADQSGGLSQREVPANVWAHIQQADSDGNGEVTPAELRAFASSHAQNAQGVRQDFQAADTSGDHKLDPAEWTAFGSPTPFADVDADGDGFITPQEVGRYMQANGGQSPF